MYLSEIRAAVEERCGSDLARGLITGGDTTKLALFCNESIPVINGPHPKITGVFLVGRREVKVQDPNAYVTSSSDLANIATISISKPPELRIEFDSIAPIVILFFGKIHLNELMENYYPLRLTEQTITGSLERTASALEREVDLLRMRKRAQ